MFAHDERPADAPVHPQLTQLDNEPVVYWGGRVLAHLIATGDTAPCDDAALEQADHAAIYAVSARDMLPAVYARISTARHLIASTLRARAADRLAVAEQPQAATSSRPKEGPMAPLRPTSLTHPPAGQKVDIPF